MKRPAATQVPRRSASAGASDGDDAHEHDAGDRAEQAEGGQRQREEHEAGGRAERRGRGPEGGADRDRRDDRADVRLEDVRAHAGHVAHVVADVVGDDAGVARVVLGDARLDLADEVGADVGALGEDPAADAEEQRHRRRAHAEALDDHRAVSGFAPKMRNRNPRPSRPERRHQQAHDRAAEERHRQRLRGALGVRRRWRCGRWPWWPSACRSSRPVRRRRRRPRRRRQTSSRDRSRAGRRG